ncbi:MAG: hypothetical protein K0V04_28095 [Deltaproteobacteria bacterium]|nr:hypothetical protein [Deltaproteobacteria bacterium]
MTVTHRSVAAAAALCLTTVLGAGCDLLDAFDNEGSTVVQLLVTHHATPQDGMFPDLAAGAADQRTFDTDDGWNIILTSAYVTTSHATLEGCNGTSIDFDPFWGQLPENMGNADLDLLSFASVEVQASTFCSMTVEYGPFTSTEGNHQMGADGDKIKGATYYMRGVAQKDGVSVPFEFSGNDTVVVDLDLSSVMSGRPLTINAEEAFPVDLTLSKTYDRFFDGIDFADFDPQDVHGNIVAMLELETRVAFGTRVAAE